MLLQCNYITEIVFVLICGEYLYQGWLLRNIHSFLAYPPTRMVASQHPLVLGLPKTLQNNSFAVVLLFRTYLLKQTLASLVGYKPLSVFNSKLLTHPMLYIRQLVAFVWHLGTKKPTLFVWAL